MSTKGLYFSVSGIGTARAADLFHKLKMRLGRYQPDYNLTFLETPFKGLPHPLTWDKAELERDATSRLMSCWALLNEHVVKKLRPALERGDIVVTHRFGLDALLYATAIERCVDENNEAERVHHAMVRIRIIEQHIKPPIYLIPKMVDLDKVASGWMTQSPALKNVGRDDLCRFVRYEETVQARYFDPKHGQNRPFYLDASLNSKEMCNVVSEYFKLAVTQARAAAA